MQFRQIVLACLQVPVQVQVQIRPVLWNKLARLRVGPTPPRSQ